MKKYLLFIISMLCVFPAVATDFGSNGSYYIASSPTLTIYIAPNAATGELSNFPSLDLTGYTKVVITGELHSFKTGQSNGYDSDGYKLTLFKDYVLDLSGATLAPFNQDYGSGDDNGYVIGNSTPDHSKNIIVPSGTNLTTFKSKVHNPYGTTPYTDVNYYTVSGTTITANINNTSDLCNLNLISTTSNSILKLDNNIAGLIDLSTVASSTNSTVKTIDLSNVTTASTGSNNITVPDKTGLIVVCPSQAICDRVVISGSPANPQTVVLSTEITASDETDLNTKVSALTAAGVKPTKITYTGTLTSDLLTSFGGTAYSDVKRLDMSGAALGSASLTDLQIPSALEELSLPAGQTVPDALKSRLAANSNLWYVYSTTSDPQTFAGQHTPDYVWVVKPGGLNRALNSEAKLRTAIYVKIASEVALNNDDAKFGNHGINASDDTDYPWQYVDLSGAVVTEAATLAATAPHGKTYRIILPNNLTGDHLAIFASNSQKGDVAGLYTYSGTTLKVLGLSTHYSPGALADNRIVRDGTKIVEFIEGKYNSVTYGIFTPTMLDAVNNMGKTSFSYDKGGNTINVTGNTIGTQVETVRILTNRVYSAYTNEYTKTVFNELTFDNPTIHTLNLSGLTNNATAVVNVNGCTNLVNLTIETTHIASVTGNITDSKLGNINMTNVTIEGNVSFQGAVQTSFTASGRIAGNIDLTNNDKLGSIDIVNVEFKTQYDVSTLQGSSDDASPSTGDLIITRSSVIDPTNGVYTGDTEGYTKITENIKVSETFGNGINNTDSKDGRIYPRIAATTKAPYSTDVAGYKQDGCALTITLDGQTENYTTLAAALNLIFGTSIADGNFSSLADICNLTINTTAKDSNPRYNLTSDDISVINSLTFSAIAEGGDNAKMYRMATLNLEGATLTSNNILTALAPNSSAGNEIRNIILPQGLDKSIVNATTFANFAANTNFNGAISTNASRSALVGYVQKPGSLYEIMTQVPDFRPNVYIYLPSPGINITDVTLSGKLLAVDISNGYDHLLANGNHSESIVYVRTTGAALEHQNSLSTLDIEDAIFVDAENTSTIKETNMTLSELGWASITSLKMPTDSRMKIVPKNFLNNCKLINYLCIPYNYEKIDNAAFHLSGTNWITTTDSKGAEIDNGNYTYTFSKNLKEIGTDPGNDANGYPITFGLTPVFNAVNSAQIHDIYILRNGYEDGLPFNPTKCYRGAFASGMTYGWGGFDGGSIYCREKYKNGAFLFTVLNYPDMASLPTANQTTNEELTGDYDKMEKAYTDVTKVYTKKDQTGAVDANGDLIPWPTFSELGRAYNQAIRGLVWNDWNIVQPDQSQGNVNGGVVTFDPAAMPDAKTEVEGTPNKNQFHDYVGWHEFVLSKATYVAPDENVVGNTIYRGYQEPQFYTFCVPFDMTPAEVLNLLGVPASDDDKKIVTTLTTLTYDGDGNVNNAASVVKNTTDLYPEIYTLKSVVRTLATSSDPNKIRLGLSKNLADSHDYWMPAGDCSGEYMSNAVTRAEDGVEVAASNVMIRGGYPYLIKAYLPQGAKAQNGSLGRYVLSRYTFPMTASSAVVRRPGTFIGLHGKTYISYFARPYDQHLVRALQADPNNNTSTAATTDDGNGGTKNYNYRFLGEYWQQWMPTNTYYLYPREHKWYYNKNVTNWKWAPYVCIINADDQSYVNPDTGEYIGALTDIINGENGSVIPYSTVDDSEGHAVFTENLKLHYSTTPIDDTVFPTAGAREFYFVFDDNDIVEVGDDNVTAIESINGVDIRPVTGKVYNMAGQYVGNSLEGLSKGMYIVNGKKIVVK